MDVLVDWVSVAIFKLHTFPLCLLARFRGRNASDPWRGASQLLAIPLLLWIHSLGIPTLEFTVRHGW